MRRGACRAILALSFVLSACGGAPDEQPAAVEDDQAPLTPTPGEWAASGTQASFADESGALLASFRCDAATAELLLDIPGAFADGAQPVMVLRAGNSMHRMDPVEVRDTGNGVVRTGRVPVGGSLTDTILDAPIPITIEPQGDRRVMIDVDEVLQGFIRNCAEQTPTTEPESIDG